MKYIISWVAFLAAMLFAVPQLARLVWGEYNEPWTAEGSPIVKVYFTDTKTVKAVPLDDYLTGVVAAEMPASFEYEALKAQAVAARTYTMSKIKSNAAAANHSGADVCTDFAHCQAYISEEKARKNWGKNASEYSKKCKNAVYETSGEIMLYDSEPVKAVFHSSSSGKTENAADVWGSDVPYLVSVDSPGEEACPSHKSEVTMTADEFKSAAAKEYGVDFKDNLIGKITKTASGFVKSVQIGNKTLKGTEVRKLYGLRSACFDVKADGGKVIFKVTGNGHGVGMSQYGANYLAAHGYDYKKILKKYYTGVTLDKIR